ncbi:lipoprotein insertase outer membrane protein LolB [Alteromonadaceae bacterium BrNp21-10]|nr:lipoprotein insertase outer membrane protein LolB [Alteromonadaceae bacterium BrNp21-10]
MKLIIYAILMMLVTACASKPPAILQPVEKQRHQQHLADLQDWQFQGRLAYIEGKQKQSASVQWQQQQKDFSLSLTTFIGIQILALSQDEEQAILEIDDQTHHADNATALLYELTQWHIPVNQMSRWLKGQKTAGDIVNYSPSGWITSLTHGQWQVNYQQYKQVNQVALPHEIVVKGQGLTIKLRINKWTLH